MTMLTSPDQIHAFRVATLISGLKLEIRGMTVSRGRSCYSILKSEFKLSGARAKVLDAAQQLLDGLKKELQAADKSNI
jgi:hypothetical protein